MNVQQTAASLMAAARTELYHCLELDSKKRQIRLLNLLPGTYDSAIKCKLIVSSLDDTPPPKYEALSYTWGASTEDRHINMVGGSSDVRLDVTDNLFRALRCLRCRYRSRQLWVDAVCIDQSNNAEKGAQVAMMGSIYEAAHVVDIWLGDRLSGLQHMRRTWIAFTRLRMLNWVRIDVLSLRWRLEGLITAWCGSSSEFEGRRLREGWFSNMRTVFKILRGEIDDIAVALESSRPQWQSRAWVVQESVLATEIYLCAGRTRTTYFPDLLPSLSILLGGPILAPDLVNFLDRLSDYRAAKPVRGEDGDLEEGLHEAAMITSGTNAQDPRDKVFSLLGIIAQAEAELLAVDYGAACWHVYAQATCASIARQWSTDILHLAGRCDVPLEDRPTWVADFAREPATLVQFKGTNLLRAEWDRFAHKHHAGKLAMGISDDFRQLYVMGVRFSTVIATLALLGNGGSSDDRVRDLQRVVDQARAQLVQRPEWTPKLHPRTDLAVLGGASPALTAPESCLEDLYTIPEYGHDASHLRFAITEVLTACFNNWASAVGITYDNGKHFLQVERSNWLVQYFTAYALDQATQVSLFATSNGFVGAAPGLLEAGDIIALTVFEGPPLVLRPSADGLQFRGFAWVHGIMNAGVFRSQRFCYGHGVQCPVEKLTLC